MYNMCKLCAIACRHLVSSDSIAIKFELLRKKSFDNLLLMVSLHYLKNSEARKSKIFKSKLFLRFGLVVFWLRYTQFYKLKIKCFLLILNED